MELRKVSGSGEGYLNKGQDPFMRKLGKILRTIAIGSAIGGSIIYGIYHFGSSDTSQEVKEILTKGQSSKDTLQTDTTKLNEYYISNETNIGN